ncbi:MAG: hypothetical protein K8F91_23760, partial [Candidatus Obscuribacterales bacterium]|nr:hypothetical protein [Candidatus Obscuribacterales bacterium]
THVKAAEGTRPGFDMGCFVVGSLPGRGPGSNEPVACSDKASMRSDNGLVSDLGENNFGD